MRKIVSFRSFGYRHRIRSTPSFFYFPNLPTHGIFISNSVRFGLGNAAGTFAQNREQQAAPVYQGTEKAVSSFVSNNKKGAVSWFSSFVVWLRAFSKRVLFRPAFHRFFSSCFSFTPFALVVMPKAAKVCLIFFLWLFAMWIILGVFKMLSDD